jgi:hypothetical protein
MDDVWKSPLQVTLICIGVLLFLCICSNFSRPATLQVELKELVQQAAQLHEQSLQDTDMAIALQHSTHALTCVGFARRLAADAVIEQTTNIKIKELESIILKTQALYISKISSREATISAIASGYAKL